MLDRTPTTLGASGPVEVREFGFDWEAGVEPGDVTAARLDQLGDALCRGAWFLNPVTVAHAPAPCAGFFAAATRARDGWIRQARGSSGNRGLCNQARTAKEGDRQAANPPDDDPSGRDVGHQIAPAPVRLADLGPERRREVLASGHLARQLGHSGIMLIDGELVPPWSWGSTAARLLHPDRVGIRVAHRPASLGHLARSGDPGPLASVTRGVLAGILGPRPDATCYVCPSCTVIAPTASPAFMAEVRVQADRWHGRIYKAVGSRKHRLMREADLPTRMLAYTGVLCIEGACFIAGCWPGERPSERALARTRFHGATVPASFLSVFEGRDVGGT